LGVGGFVGSIKLTISKTVNENFQQISYYNAVIFNISNYLQDLLRLPNCTRGDLNYSQTRAITTAQTSSARELSAERTAVKQTMYLRQCLCVDNTFLKEPDTQTRRRMYTFKWVQT